MKFLPQSAKYYKKTAFLTDIIALVIIWGAYFLLPFNILTASVMLVLNVWIWISGPAFTKLGEWIIKNRNENID